MMDWVNTICLMTPADNLEDAQVANIKGNGTTNLQLDFILQCKGNALQCRGRGASLQWKGQTIWQQWHLQNDWNLHPWFYLPVILTGSKMQPQYKEPTIGNEFIARCSNPGYNQFHQSFYHFFGCQNPLTVPPLRDECPNFKVDEFICWLQYAWKEAWILGKNSSVDKQI